MAGLTPGARTRTVERLAGRQAALFEKLFSRSIFLQDCCVVRTRCGALLFVMSWHHRPQGGAN